MINSRRHFLAWLASMGITPTLAQTPEVSRMTAYAFSFPALDGAALRLADYAGRPVLVVNTASLCGYTPQYSDLQELWTRFKDRGLVIIGVPSNDFGGQEPGEAAEISHTAHQTYGVTFPVVGKVAVRGPSPHPFYKWAAIERPLETPRWNFHKYLVGRDGRLAASFPSATTPRDERLVAAIEKELASAPASAR